MSVEELSHLINFKLKSIALSRFDSQREYAYVISPFSRLYYITEGNGWLMIDGEKIVLEPNYIYLIPSYTPCSYYFDQYLEHYYIHFETALINGLNVYKLYRAERKMKSSDLDLLLFKRLLEINPNLALPHPDPDVYQKKEWLNTPVKYSNPSLLVESRGILEQLLSRFIIDENSSMGNVELRYNIRPIMEYIQANLKENIKIETLAQMACLSNDHFTKIFKSIVSIPPNEFIIKKRIEKAQFLLLTTDLPIKKIFEECGFKSLAYFSRIFKKYTSKSPSYYRSHGEPKYK
ncbi:MAG: AraC family transcriptional regulator [Carboxylicivirga sp.]|nr:AraC family transcriptional regulator [Carboxylicivirga sp.]